MKQIKLSRDEEATLRMIMEYAHHHLNLEGHEKSFESLMFQLHNAPDDTVMFMELVEKKIP